MPPNTMAKILRLQAAHFDITAITYYFQFKSESLVSLSDLKWWWRCYGDFHRENYYSVCDYNTLFFFIAFSLSPFLLAFLLVFLLAFLSVFLPIYTGNLISLSLSSQISCAFRISNETQSNKCTKCGMRRYLMHGNKWRAREKNQHKKKK